jgi:two-component system, OmpR family, response regulator MprA
VNNEPPGAAVVDSTLETLLRALSAGPQQLAGGDDAPVMVVVLAREAGRVADSLGVRTGALRAPVEAPPEVAVGFGDLVLDGHTREVHRGGRALSLTVTEFRLLEFLLRHPRQVLPRGMIFDRVWGFDLAATSNSLTVYIGYLRRKTEAGGEPRLIHTVRGVGYVLRD